MSAAVDFDHVRRLAAERQRRRRERRRLGLRCVTIQIDEHTITCLIRSGRIDAECASDDALLAESLSCLLEQW